MQNVQLLSACVSGEEKKRRFGVATVNIFLWFILLILCLVSWGVILLLYAFTWLVNRILSEYNVRKLQALGTAATEQQFPEIFQALGVVCEKFDVKEIPKVIVVSESHVNAFALRFAQKKVVVMLSKTLEGVLDKPDELRFFLGHEIAHIILDHGARGKFELYKPAAYRAARELTCDNCGCAAAGNLEAARRALKRLGVGNRLLDRLNDEYLVSEGTYIYSGFTGWLLKQNLTYPPIGKRIENVTSFCESGV